MTTRHVAGTGLLAVTLALGLLPKTAWAVNGITYVSARSAESSNPTRFVEAKCPTGTRAIGGSAVIAGPSSIVVNSAAPTETPATASSPLKTSFEVFASEPAGGIADTWYVVANVICVPSGQLPGLEYREQFSSYDSTAVHTATVSCSAGNKLIGVGGVVDSNGPGQDRLVLTAIVPADDLTSLIVQGHESEAGYDSNWRVKAIAVCARPLPGQQLIRASSANDAIDHKLARAACPSGTLIHSVGFDLRNGAGRVHATRFFPDVDLNNNPNVQGVEVQAQEDANGFLTITRLGIDGPVVTNNKWFVSALGICAR